MLLTAHGGALKTGRNSKLYFDTIKNHTVDVIEVDVRRRSGRLYIAHLKALFSKKAIPLSYVFEYIKENNLKVNCDLKEKGIIGDVIKLAEEIGVKERLIFTGFIRQSDLPKITAGEVYVNTVYYFPVFPTVGNLERIKEILDKSNNEHIAGLNLHYKFVSNDFIRKAKELRIPLSVYTVDDVTELKRLIPLNLANITTNIVTEALDIINNHKAK